MSIWRGTTSLYTPKSSFGCSFERCEWLTLSHLDEENRAYWNNDGIDVTDCRHVRISDCRVNAADDGICLKSDCADLCNYDVEIARCDIRSSASAVKFGTASWGGFRKIHVHDITVRDTFRSCIAIESVDGGIIDSVLVERIEAENDVPEEVGKYPEFSMFGELPAWGFYVRHINRITFHCVHLSLRDSDFRPAFVFDDVRQLTMEQVTPDESVFN